MGQTFWMTHSHKKISIYSDVQSRQNWFSLRETHGQFRHFCISVAVDLDLMTSPGSRNLVITKHRWGRSDMSSHMIQPWYWDGGDQHWPCTPPCQIHTTWEKCRYPFDQPCGGIWFPDGDGVFLCLQPLYDPATMGRRKLLAWTWAWLSSF